MDEEKTDKPDDSREIDLSALSALDFNPEWASANAKKISLEKVHGESDRRGSRRGFKGDPDSSRNRRFKNSPKEGSAPEGSKPFSRDRKHSRHNRRDSRFAQFAMLPRVAEVAIYPEDKRFAVLSKAMKNSSRTYILFDIARIVLEKPERFVVVVTPPQKKGNEGEDKSAATPPAPFFVSVPDGLPFLSESDAIAHVFKTHAEKFFTAEEIEIEPPKGNFAMIAKCGFTGELLAPPNYHAYQQILRDHHAANFPRMPFEKFMSRIETVKEPEQINAWLEKMKKVTRYVVKDRTEGEPEFLESESAAKNFLATKRKEQAVKETRQARFSGALVEPMPMGPLRSAILHEIQYQRKFPLNTANNLRGKLRYLGFTLYKKGSNGITLVCGVKRKFRTPDSVFSDTIQRIFDFLDKNPGTPLLELPTKMFGIEPKKKSDVPAVEVPETPASVGKTERAHEPKETEDVSSASEAVLSEAEVPKEESPTAPVTEEVQATSVEESQAKELLGTMRWLVNEGYVTEMSDGKLYAQPVITVAQAKAKPELEEGKANSEEEKLPDATPEETPTEDQIANEEPKKPAAESAKEDL